MQTIVPASAMHIQRVDYLFRASYSPALNDSQECLLVQSLPVNRWSPVHDTRKYFSPIPYALNLGWFSYIKLLLPDIYTSSDELSLTIGGILSLNRRTVLTPQSSPELFTCRKPYN